MSGHEDRVAGIVASAFAPLVDEVRRDALGNVIALKRGSAGGREGPGRRPPRVMWAAHMDEIGLMVREVRDDGFLRVATIGGMGLDTLPGQEVVVHGRTDLPGIVGTKPPHLLSPDERRRPTPLDDIFIDIGFGGAAARERVSAGDVVTLRGAFRRLAGSRASGKALDDRAGVAAMYEGLRVLAGLMHEADVFVVATVQEEVGLRGATTAAYGVVPDVGIAVDGNFADQPGVLEDDRVKIGGGVDVTRGANIHPAVFERLVATARAHGIPHQVSVEPGATGTDAWAMQVSRAGMATGLLGVPLRYMHSAVEVVDLEDVRATGRLLAHFSAGIAAADREGWSHDG